MLEIHFFYHTLKIGTDAVACGVGAAVCDWAFYWYYLREHLTPVHKSGTISSMFRNLENVLSSNKNNIPFEESIGKKKCYFIPISIACCAVSVAMTEYAISYMVDTSGNIDNNNDDMFFFD